jgi:hypothetical protein
MSKSLVTDGKDLRRLPLPMRKANLSRLLARRMDGISDGTGGNDFQAPRHLSQGAKFLLWVKVKNRQRPAFARVQEQL